MKTGLIKKMKKKLAACLAAFLLAANVVPAEMGASDIKAISTPAPITKAVYGAVYRKEEVVPVKSSLAGMPLSWNLLTQLNNGLMTKMLASYDTPFIKLSSDERYMAFMTLPLDDEQAAGRKMLYIQDRHTGECTTELGVTAKVADAKANLQISGKATESGAANTMAIPSDRIIRVVVESESGQQKAYTDR